MRANASRLLVDTGFLVALLDHSDKHHLAATKWLRQFDGTLISVQDVLTETSFFLGRETTAKLLEQVAAGWIELFTPEPTGYRRVATLLRKYADLDPDLTDIVLIWLAESTGVHGILTVDLSDFATYRIHGKSKFDLVPWQD